MPERRDIRPITQLKNRTADLVREVSEHGRPITITQNGEARVVVMDVENYDRWRAWMALLKLLAAGEADVERGRTVKQAEAFRRARKELDRTRRDGQPPVPDPMGKTCCWSDSSAPPEIGLPRLQTVRRRFESRRTHQPTRCARAARCPGVSFVAMAPSAHVVTPG